MTSDLAILTGDLIGSTDAAPEALEASMARLASTADEIGGWHEVAPRFTRYRGDGWQFCTGPKVCLRALLYLHACLRAQEGLLETRVSIGLGPVDSLGTANLSDAQGPAFTASGHGLDSMPRTRRFALAGPATDTRDSIIVHLIEEIALRWTRPQAAAAALVLAPAAPTLAEAGRILGITSQAVNYRMWGGGVQSLRDAITAWEADREARGG